MSELVIINEGKPVTTSLKVAEVFGKEHRDVLKAVRNLDCSKEFNERNFALVEYEDGKGEKRPSYTITKDGFVFLAMGFKGKKAAEFKEAYIAEFNKMESAIHQGSAGDLSAIADLVVAKQLAAIRQVAEENVRLKHDVSFMSHFMPRGKPGELSKSGLPKNQYRRSYYVSRNGKDVGLLVEHPTLPGLFEEYKRVSA